MPTTTENITHQELETYLNARLRIAQEHVDYYEGLHNNNSYMVREVTMLKALWDMLAQSHATLRICTGCGHRSDRKMTTASPCCPDSNYVDLDEYIKRSLAVGRQNFERIQQYRCHHCGSTNIETDI